MCHFGREREHPFSEVSPFSFRRTTVLRATRLLEMCAIIVYACWATCRFTARIRSTGNRARQKYFVSRGKQLWQTTSMLGPESPAPNCTAWRWSRDHDHDLQRTAPVCNCSVRSTQKAHGQAKNKVFTISQAKLSESERGSACSASLTGPRVPGASLSDFSPFFLP